MGNSDDSPYDFGSGKAKHLKPNSLKEIVLNILKNLCGL
jgi:hypothetical protein